MADDIQLNAGSGGDKTRAKDRTTAKTTVVVLDLNTGGSEALNQGAIPLQGDVAHDAADAGSPVLLGARAIAFGANPTAVAADDRTRLLANRAGGLFLTGPHPNLVTVRLQFTAAQTDVAVVTVATGLKIVVTGYSITLDNASTVFPSVRMGFGTANTPTTTGVIAAHGGLPAGGGMIRDAGIGYLGVGADNEDLRITTVGTATGNGVEVVVTYYTIES